MLGTLLSACTAPGRSESIPVEHSSPTSRVSLEDPSGRVGPGVDDFVDPEHVDEVVQVPEPTPVGLPDLTEHELSPLDEDAALTVAQDFVTTIWTWDYTDDTDRAGLRRALPLASHRLQDELRPYLEQPIYSPWEWSQRSASATVGSAVQVVTLGPAPLGVFDADTYTVQIAYRLFELGDEGYPIPRDEDARQATVEVTRGPDAPGWLVSALPYLRDEQIVETAG